MNPVGVTRQHETSRRDIPSVVSNASHEADAELGRTLREKRLASRTPLSQTQIAREAGVSQPLISHLERGYRSMRTLPGDLVGAILSAYGFSRQQQTELVRRFGLQVPPFVLDPARERALARVERIVLEGTLSHPSEEAGTIELPAELLEGHRVEMLRARRVTEADYTTPAARRHVEEGGVLILSMDERPQQGDLCVYHAPGGPDFLAEYDPDDGLGLIGSWLLPIAQDGRPLQVTTRPTCGSVVVGLWRPFLRPRAS
ncbi:MAG TPA: helix-turn-helix transcriptional regulator [Longimicrobiales bacterium]